MNWGPRSETMSEGSAYFQNISLTNNSLADGSLGRGRNQTNLLNMSMMVRTTIFPAEWAGQLKSPVLGVTMGDRRRLGPSVTPFGPLGRASPKIACILAGLILICPSAKINPRTETEAACNGSYISQEPTIKRTSPERLVKANSGQI